MAQAPILFTTAVIRQISKAELYESLVDVVEQAESDEQSGLADSISYREGKTILPEYAELFEQNGDMVGWITVPDTKINYPVMQSKNEPDFYLKHGFDRAYSSYGCPYVQENRDAKMEGHYAKDAL